MRVARVSKKDVQAALWAGISGPKRLVRTPPPEGVPISKQASPGRERI